GGRSSSMRGNELDAVLQNRASRRKFLQGMGVMAASGVLAACRKDVSSNSAGAGATSAGPRPSIEAEPAVMHVHEWAGYDAPWLFKDYTAQGFQDPKFSFFVNTEGVLAKTAAGFEYDLTHPEVGYIQDFINLDAIQPWDTTLISNFPRLNPVLEKTGVIDGKQY